MLKGLDPLLHADLLHVLAAMGHGDELALVDANFPAAAVARRLVRLDGVDAPRALAAVLSVLPLDAFTDTPCHVMAVVGDPVYNRCVSIQFLRHRFTVDEYHGMARAGALTEDDRVELVEGEIVDLTPIGLRHAAAVNVLNRWLTTGCGTRAIVQVQGPLRLGPQSELQPDLVALRPRDDFYRTAAATPDDVLLVVEVADTSLPYDRTVKLPLYARAGIREAWLVDLVRDRVEIATDPGPDGYRRTEGRERGGRLVPAAFPDLSLSVDALLG